MAKHYMHSSKFMHSCDSRAAVATLAVTAAEDKPASMAERRRQQQEQQQQVQAQLYTSALTPKPHLT
jgi:hypothetical protein